MPKAVRRARRPRANALAAPAQRPLLDRILDTPNLAHVVPRLQPELLHRVIQKCGLEDCGELLALTTPDQLARVIDLDLWRADQPGTDEQFDAERFGVWLEVLMESGPSVAAHKLAQIDAGLVIGALAQHARVFDCAAVSPPASMDGEEEPTIGAKDEGISANVGGYLIVAKRTNAWDAIVAVLGALDAEHRTYFHRVMRGCRSLSNAGFELDGLHDLLSNDAQVMFDLASARERRREQQGYVTPAQARAFLKMARQRQPGHGAPPPANPIAVAHFRAVESADAPPAPEESADEAAAVVEMLSALNEAGVLAPTARALLEGPQGRAPRLARIQAYMQSAADGDPAVFATRSQELAYLANTIVAGCSIQARPFTAQEASDAAVAICNLGLEHWPDGQDLISVFQVGWTVLHDDVAMYTAERLVGILRGMRCEDRETQAGLNALRIEMKKHWRAGAPWRARDALDVIATLDMPAWAALLGLIDECPVIHAGMAASRDSRTRAVSPSDFEFISENSQIASVREFMQSLPKILR